MSRDSIIDGFAGGASADGSARSRCEISCHLLGNKNYSDFVLPAPHNTAENVVFDTLNAKDQMIARASFWIDNYDCAGKSKIRHLAGYAFNFPLDPNSGALGLWRRSKICHLTFFNNATKTIICLHLPGIMFILYVSKIQTIKRKYSPLDGLGRFTRGWDEANDLPLFAGE
ncbi:hypothetical protein [Methylobacterium currus]|uniref:hypothetical protein n=1 Tax=Methylobacterium currus TaxID=2051553 RepID=UPI000F4F9918|nr:hypothetical protein [Methylobacterium currus]